MAIIIGDSTNNIVSGTNSADLIVGGSGDDTLSGGNGNDLLFGGCGDDSIDGGNGNDLLFGGSGEDAIDGGNGNDFVDGGSGDDVINGGNGNDLLFGDSGNDVIDGGNGSDLIFGGSGNDVLIGVGGADWMQGGSGNDMFVYQSASDSNAGGWDRILDFTQGQDKIDLSDLLGPTTDLAWGNKTATANGAWYLNSGSSTFVLADIDGDGKADLKIELKNTYNLALTANDFLGVGMTPVASDGAALGDEDTALAGTLKATDPDGGKLQFALDKGPAHGTLELDSVNGTYIYKPDANFNGSDSFTYKVNDGSSESNVATVKLTVKSVNDDAAITGHASGAVKEAGGVANETTNDPSASGHLMVHDVDAGEAAFQAVAIESLEGSYGNFTFNENTGAWTYTLDQGKADSLAKDQQETDALTVQSLDGTASQTITVNITGANDAAVIGGVSTGDVNEDVAGESGHLLTGGLLSIADADQGQSNFSEQAGAAGDHGYGTFTLAANGAWTYSADNTQTAIQQLGEGESITDSFTADSSDGSASQLVTITIHGTNDVSVIDGVSTGDVKEDVAAVSDHLLTGGLLGIADADQGQSNFSEQTGAAGDHGYGTFTLAANGAWTYSADNTQTAIQQLGEGESITDSFTAVSSDGSASQLVTLTIHGTNDVPVAVADVNGADVVTEAGVNPGDSIATGNLLANDTDADTGDGKTVTTTGSFTGTYGSVVIADDGTWTYTLDNTDTDTNALAQGANVTDTFNYTMEDTAGATSSSTLKITITGTNDAPVAVGDNVITNEALDGMFAIPEWALLANDSDPDGDPLDVQGVFAAVDATVTHTAGTNSSNGYVEFKDDIGSDGGSFSYQATDGLAPSAPAIVSVTSDALDEILTGTSGADIIVAGPQSGSVTLVGNGGNDILVGNADTNTLDGGSGNDILYGGAGNDTLTGGSDSDLFDYNALSDRGTTGDVITDFQKGTDNLDLHDLLSTFSGIAADHSDAFTGGFLFFNGNQVQVDRDGSAGEGDSFNTLVTLNVALDPISDQGDFIL